MVVAFEDMIRHNSRTVCNRESVKTSSDSEDSNPSDEFGKGTFEFIMKKPQKCDFPDVFLWEFFKKFEKSFHASLWAFSKRFFLAWTMFEDSNWKKKKLQPQCVIIVSGKKV